MVRVCGRQNAFMLTNGSKKMVDGSFLVPVDDVPVGYIFTVNASYSNIT